jgi:hypothetical protein
MLQFNIACYLETQGQHEATEKLHYQTLEETQQKLVKDHLDTVMSSNNVATVFWRCGRYNEAEKMFREILKSLEDTLGYNHPDILINCSNLLTCFGIGACTRRRK